MRFQGARPHPSLILHRTLDLGGVLLDFAGRITRPWPEETSQPVALGPRHHVHVEVRDGLADEVVDGDERPLCSEGVEDGSGSSLNVAQKWLHQALWQIKQCLDMANRCDQDMTLEHRPMIKERDHLLVPGNNRSVQFATDDLTDHIAHGDETSVPLAPLS